MCVCNPVLLIRMQGQGAAHKLGAHPTLVPPHFLTRAAGGWKWPHDREGCCSLLQAIHLCKAPTSLLFLKLPSAVLLTNTISKLAGTRAAWAPTLQGQVPDLCRFPLQEHVQVAAYSPSVIPGDGKTNQPAMQASDSSKIKSF